MFKQAGPGPLKMTYFWPILLNTSEPRRQTKCGVKSSSQHPFQHLTQAAHVSVWRQKTGVTEFTEPTEGQDCDTLGQNVGLLGGSTRVPSRSSMTVSGHTGVAHKNIRVVHKCALCSLAIA